VADDLAEQGTALEKLRGEIVEWVRPAIGMSMSGHTAQSAEATLDHPLPASPTRLMSLSFNSAKDLRTTVT
jgi:hypothetical protein